MKKPALFGAAPEEGTTLLLDVIISESTAIKP
jgi:hypothetical protein